MRKLFIPACSHAIACMRSHACSAMTPGVNFGSGSWGTFKPFRLLLDLHEHQCVLLPMLHPLRG